MLRHLAVLDTEDVEGVVVIRVGWIAWIFVLVFEDEPHEVSLRSRDHRHLVRRHVFWNRVHWLAAELSEEFDKSGATRIRVGIVLDIALGLVFGCKLEMTGIEHFTPPRHNHLQILFLFRSHRSSLWL